MSKKTNPTAIFNYAIEANTRVEIDLGGIGSQLTSTRPFSAGGTLFCAGFPHRIPKDLLRGSCVAFSLLGDAPASVTVTRA
jgi:hypothetical protein